MTKFFTVLLIFASILLGSLQVYGVSAYPNPVEYKLPDGSTITIKMMGDERVKWAETADGYSILLNKEGFYEYTMHNSKGDMVRSGIRATDKLKRTSEELLFLSKIPANLRYSKSQVSIMKQIWSVRESEMKSSKAFPTMGNRKLICILIGFQDKAFVKTKTDFENLFNQVGYTEGGATGSVKDYYLENSYNQFNLTVDVAGPYTASKNMVEYGGNDENDNDKDPRALVREAVILANPDVNYADYDNDNDGYVDAVYIIYAGYGEEAGGGDDAIWAHAWALWPTETLDGKQIYRYSCSAELRGNTGTNITRIGVVCHEFGHVLGAPDYYDTDYTTGGQFTGTGQWDMMAGGSWNNGGATPAHHNGFTKVVYYKWATVTELSTVQLVTLSNAVENKNSFYKINTTTPGEYFFLEYREKHKFDSNIPGSGLLIYHVHSDVMSAGNSNNINNTHPQKMYIVSQNATMDPTADPASYGTINSASSAWTGVGKNEFTDNSLPSSKSWAGANTGKSITNISRDAINKTVSFDIALGSVPRVSLFEESFEGEIFPPSGWTLQSTVTDFSWKTTTGYSISTEPPTPIAPQHGTKFAYVQWQKVTNQNEWLITPSLDLSEESNVQLSFYFNGSFYWSITNDFCDLTVKARIGEGEWVDLWAESDYGTFSDYVWNGVVLSNLVNYEGQNNVKFAFVYTGNDGANFNIDNIVLSKAGEPTTIDHNLVSNLKVYPNPFSNFITVENVEGISRATLTNLIGQKMVDIQFVGTNIETISTEKLAKGVYLLTLFSANGQKQVRKIIKD